MTGPDDQAILEVLRRSDLLAGLDDADLRAVVEAGEVQRLVSGTALVSSARRNRRVFVLLDGEVEVLRDGAARSERVARLGPGACIGEMSALTSRPATMTVRALGDVRVLSIDGEDLRERLEDVPHLGSNLATVLMERLQGHLVRRATSVTLITVDGADAVALDSARRLVAASARYGARTIIVARAPHLHFSDHPPLPPVTAWGADASRSHGVLRSLRTTTRGSWSLSADGFGDDRIEGVLDLLAPMCDHLIVLADAAQARATLASCAGRYRRHVAVGRSMEPGGEVERRFLMVDAPAPATVAEARLLDARNDAVTYGLEGGARGLDALGRDLASMRVGIALGSGASRGFAHIGVLERLTERGVPLDAIVGSSAGAGIGFLWALGDPPERITRRFAELQRHAVQWTIPFRSLFSGARLGAHLRRCADGRTFGDVRVPYGAVAVDLYGARERMFTEGAVDQCVLASCAIPGIYPPVCIEGRWYSDGGLLHPVPTGFVRPLGADRVITVDLGVSADGAVPPRPPNLLDVLRESASLMHARISEQSQRGADVVLRPGTTNLAPGSLDYAAADGWRALGRDAVDAAWPEILAIFPWLEGPMA